MFFGNFEIIILVDLMDGNQLFIYDWHIFAKGVIFSKFWNPKCRLPVSKGWGWKGIPAPATSTTRKQFSYHPLHHRSLLGHSWTYSEVKNIQKSFCWENKQKIRPSPLWERNFCAISYVSMNICSKKSPENTHTTFSRWKSTTYSKKVINVLLNKRINL